MNKLDSCKYKLPCGYCDKFDKPCDKVGAWWDLEEEKLEEKTLRLQAECMHEWMLLKTTWNDYPLMHQVEEYECRKCKLKKYNHLRSSEV